MKQIRKRLTYANVMSSIAVFLIGTNVVPFKVSQMVGMIVISALPFLAVVATEVPIVDLLKQLAGVVL